LISRMHRRFDFFMTSDFLESQQWHDGFAMDGCCIIKSTRTINLATTQSLYIKFSYLPLIVRNIYHTSIHTLFNRSATSLFMHEARDWRQGTRAIRSAETVFVGPSMRLQ